MSLRAAVFAVVLLAAGALITRGAYLAEEAAGWIVGGVVLGLAGWLVLSE